MNLFLVLMIGVGAWLLLKKDTGYYAGQFEFVDYEVDGVRHVISDGDTLPIGEFPFRVSFKNTGTEEGTFCYLFDLRLASDYEGGGIVIMPGPNGKAACGGGHEPGETRTYSSGIFEVVEGEQILHIQINAFEPVSGGSIEHLFESFHWTLYGV